MSQASPEKTLDQQHLEMYASVAKKASQLVAEFIKRNSSQMPSMPSDEVGIAKSFMELSTKMLSNPGKLIDTQLSMMWDHFSLWQSSVFRVIGVTTPPVSKPETGDKRFKNEIWENNLLFDFIKQSYLITSGRIRESVGNTRGIDAATLSKVSFFTRQFIDALSPTNFAITNPQVLQEIVNSGGKNLIKGLSNLLHDIDEKGQLRVRMTDLNSFELGKNVATTPGKVVYQNELFQLIQFDASTKETLKRPLLIIPPWINKYYILDLSEKNSYIKWCVDQGHTTFIISWVNPDERLARKSFEDYLLDGAFEALNQVNEICGEEKVNLTSYCIGGTLTMILLAYLAAKKDDRVASATFFTTMLDFADPGELGVFLGKDTIENLVTKMEKRGFLDGAEMANTFNTLRQNDLIWSFVINNYLMGKDPFPFDLLYWNSDSTRMPAAMHAYYLRNMYLYNKLIEIGGLQMGGVSLDIRQVKVPCYFLSTLEDHIAPWKSTYSGAKLPQGEVKFVLGGSGHIAGVVNPPTANKYGYRTLAGKLPGNPDDFLEKAEVNPGSWWNDWHSWVCGQTDGNITIPARQPGDNGNKIIEAAPGSYAKFRLDAGKRKKSTKSSAAHASDVSSEKPATLSEAASQSAQPAIATNKQLSEPAVSSAAKTSVSKAEEKVVAKASKSTTSSATSSKTGSDISASVASNKSKTAKPAATSKVISQKAAGKAKKEKKS